MGKEEKSSWKRAAVAFLQAAYDMDQEEDAIKKMPHKLNRLASFYLAHACDKQLQACGVGGYKKFFPVDADGTPFERRPLLIENQDSYSVNTCKSFF